MENKLIECFLAATETLNFTSAAQQVHITQPAFSRNIAALEEDFGFALFLRSKKNGLRITPAGLVMYNGLKDMEKQRGQLMEQARCISRGEEGKLVLGILNGCCLDSETFELIHKFQKLFPRVELIPKCCKYAQLLNSVETGACDVCFAIADTTKLHENLLFEHAYRAESYLAVPAHLQCSEDSIYHLIDFRNEVFLLSEDAPEINRMFVEACRQAGFEPKTRMAPDYETKMLLVEIGQGIAAHNKDYYLKYSHYVSFVHVAELRELECNIVWHKENYNPAIALLYSMLE